MGVKYDLNASWISRVSASSRLVSSRLQPQCSMHHQESSCQDMLTLAPQIRYTLMTWCLPPSHHLTSRPPSMPSQDWGFRFHFRFGVGPHRTSGYGVRAQTPCSRVSCPARWSEFASGVVLQVLGRCSLAHTLLVQARPAFGQPRQPPLRTVRVLVSR